MLKHMIMFAAVAGLVLALAPAAHAVPIEVVDKLWDQTSDIRSPANNPYFGAQTAHVAAVNFLGEIDPPARKDDGGDPAGGTLNGVVFHDEVHQGTGPDSIVAGNGFAAGVTMDYYFMGSLVRNLYTSTDMSAQTDGVVATNVSRSTAHTQWDSDPMIYFDLHGLLPNERVYIQMWGGEDPTWSTGLVNTEINSDGTLLGWDSQTNDLNAYLQGIEATSDASGDLLIELKTEHMNNFAFGGIIVQQVPEPATMALLGIGGLGMLLRRRRRA